MRILFQVLEAAGGGLRAARAGIGVARTRVSHARARLPRANLTTALQQFTPLFSNGAHANWSRSTQTLRTYSNGSRSLIRSAARSGRVFLPRGALAATSRSTAHATGLQSARQFSSSGPIFNNVIANVPIGLRLVAHEADCGFDKRKLRQQIRTQVKHGQRAAPVYTFPWRTARRRLCLIYERRCVNKRRWIEMNTLNWQSRVWKRLCRRRRRFELSFP